jgi:hypothetical protein
MSLFWMSLCLVSLYWMMLSVLLNFFMWSVVVPHYTVKHAWDTPTYFAYPNGRCKCIRLSNLLCFSLLQDKLECLYRNCIWKKAWKTLQGHKLWLILPQKALKNKLENTEHPPLRLGSHLIKNCLFCHLKWGKIS